MADQLMAPARDTVLIVTGPPVRTTPRCTPSRVIQILPAFSTERPSPGNRRSYALHGPFEWLLMPWALMVNWHHPARRRLLVIAAVIFYLGRVCGALYFAPAALYWGGHPEAAAQLDQVARCIHLDLMRLVGQDAVNAALLLVAALHPSFRPFARPVSATAAHA